MSGAVIRIVDFETSGFEPPDAQVCEVGICDLTQSPEGGWTVGHPHSWLCGVPVIPPEVRAVHHITLAEVQGRSPFNPDALCADLSAVSAWAAHNAEFESRFFQSNALSICTYKAALRVWPEAPSHSNGALRYWLEDQGLIAPDAALCQPAHRAGPDAYVTAHLLKALFAAGATGKQMVQWTREPRLLPTCPIGKSRGKPWAEVETGFLGWMLAQPTMEADLKWNAQRELDRRVDA